MPFVTEELFQRLPRRKGDNVPSIVVSKYPLPDEVMQQHFMLFHNFPYSYIIHLMILNLL